MNAYNLTAAAVLIVGLAVVILTRQALFALIQHRRVRGWTARARAHDRRVRMTRQIIHKDLYDVEIDNLFLGMLELPVDPPTAPWRKPHGTGPTILVEGSRAK